MIYDLEVKADIYAIFAFGLSVVWIRQYESVQAVRRIKQMKLV